MKRTVCHNYQVKGSSLILSDSQSSFIGDRKWKSTSPRWPHLHLLLLLLAVAVVVVVVVVVDVVIKQNMPGFLCCQAGSIFRVMTARLHSREARSGWGGGAAYGYTVIGAIRFWPLFLKRWLGVGCLSPCISPTLFTMHRSVSRGVNPFPLNSTSVMGCYCWAERLDPLPISVRRADSYGYSHARYVMHFIQEHEN